MCAQVFGLDPEGRGLLKSPTGVGDGLLPLTGGGPYWWLDGRGQAYARHLRVAWLRVVATGRRVPSRRPRDASVCISLCAVLP